MRAELRKVTWPTQDETTRATVGVLVVRRRSSATALSLVDLGLARLMQLVLP